MKPARRSTSIGAVTRRTICISALIVLPTLAWADGVMRPVGSGYPGEFLRHRMTSIDVTLTGQLAQTSVYAEYVNESNQSINAVFSFPLPPDARATDFFYWSNDTMYRAVLRVRQQAPNPGTGEGGIDAVLTNYLGSNGIRILITDILPGAVQRVQLEYISLCPYVQGKVDYRFPLKTDLFTSYPLDDVSIAVRVHTVDPILSTELEGFEESVTRTETAYQRVVSAGQPKMYLSHDVHFSYTTDHDSLNAEFYPAPSDTMDGHFVLVINPPVGEGGEDVMPKNVVFVIDRSVLQSGASIAEYRKAIGSCLVALQPADSFSIITFDYNVVEWPPGFAPASVAMVDSALAYVDLVSTFPGSNLSTAIAHALRTFSSAASNNLVVLFSDGKATVDPEAIRAMNVTKAAILPVASATTSGRPRLEMLAYENYGFSTFFTSAEPIVPETERLFRRISFPVWRDVRYEVGSDVHDLLPAAMPTLFKGSRLFLTGRFHSAGTRTLSMAGFTSTGAAFADVTLTFPGDPAGNRFAEKFWAKEKIDELERRIAVFGEVDSLKEAVIELSLRYRIRCKYTAYVADRSEVVSTLDVLEAVAIASITYETRPDGVMLTWEASGGKAIESVRIYRRSTPESEPVLIATLPGTATSFHDGTAPAGSPSYIVELMTTDGRVVRSREVSAADGVIPDRVALGQNFPNPFNPATVIDFDVSRESDVSIVVYDLLGREMARLVDGRYFPGRYSVRFDAASQGLTSGVYVYRLRTGRVSITRTMVLAH